MNPEHDDDRAPESFIPTAQDREGDEMWEGMVLHCEVRDSKGRFCPEKPTDRVFHRGRFVNLCPRCFSEQQAGAYK